MTTTTLLELEHSYAESVPLLSVPWHASVPAADLIVLNEPLARELGVDPARLRDRAGLDLLVGQVPEGAKTFAQAYAGHQFGSYVPRLGDGRAILLGEVVDIHGRRRDLHLKGAGRTRFARGGDGKAVVGPMLREYLIGEAMHGLGIPTTRGLSVVATGERVWRETAQPGAVLCRVAASHLRVGTFQYAAAHDDPQLLRDLADYAIARHYPASAEADNPYLDLLAKVVHAQAELVARWMQVGFVHGVMNTDNMAISGESIDFGPCAFMDAYDPATVFSSIDHGGRYAYGNQPAAAQWNLARFAETLLPLIDEQPEAAIEQATDKLAEFAVHYVLRADEGFAAKLGLAEPDGDLVVDLLTLLGEEKVDFTGFFRALAAGTAADLFTNQARFEAWAQRREASLPGDPPGVREAMNRVNPRYVPRNHRVEEALAAGARGDLGPLHHLVDAVSSPFDERPGFDDLTGPGPANGRPYVTYCGT